jgi:hypothetical protein
MSTSGYSRTPRLLKGAIVAFRPPVPVPSVIAFQINPETMSRTLEARMAEGQGAGAGDPFRLSGAPKESIKVECVFDATDDLNAGNADAEKTGLHQRLAALETLIYPSSATVIANTVLLNLGTIEVLPANAPFTVFIWGAKRILPVQLSGLSVTEEAFDPNLNPIRAKVSLDMKVLSYSDLQQTHPGYAMFLSHQIDKEQLAARATLKNLGSVLGGDVRLV